MTEDVFRLSVVVSTQVRCVTKVQKLIIFFSFWIGQLEKENKELQAKMNKLKQVAVKAKKETENVKKKVKFDFLMNVSLSIAH